MNVRSVMFGAFLSSVLLAGCSGPDGEQATNAERGESSASSLPIKVLSPDDVVLESMAVNTALSPEAGDPKRGIEIMSDRKRGNCVACHQVSALADVPFQGNVGPSLDGVADRWQEGFLRSLVVNPKTFFPNTAMPAYFRTAGLKRVREEFAGKPILTAQEVEDVIAFLKTLRTGD